MAEQPAPRIVSASADLPRRSPDEPVIARLKRKQRSCSRSYTYRIVDNPAVSLLTARCARMNLLHATNTMPMMPICSCGQSISPSFRKDFAVSLGTSRHTVLTEYALSCSLRADADRRYSHQRQRAGGSTCRASRFITSDYSISTRGHPYSTKDLIDAVPIRGILPTGSFSIGTAFRTQARPLRSAWGPLPIGRFQLSHCVLTIAVSVDRHPDLHSDDASDGPPPRREVRPATPSRRKS